MSVEQLKEKLINLKDEIESLLKEIEPDPVKQTQPAAWKEMQDSFIAEMVAEEKKILDSYFTELTGIDVTRPLPDPEVPDFEQDLWFPVKDVTTEFVRSGLSRVCEDENVAGIFVGSKEGVEHDDKVDAAALVADFKRDMQKHDEAMERMLTHPRKEPPFTMCGIQHYVEKTVHNTCGNFEPDDRTTSALDDEPEPDNVCCRLPKALPADESITESEIINGKRCFDLIGNILINTCLIDKESAQAYSRLIVQSLKKEGFIC